MSESTTPPTRVWHYWLLWVIVIISLGLNGLLIYGLLSARTQAGQEVARVATALRDNPMGDFEIPVNVDEMLPISMDVPFEDTFTVEISETIPVSTSVLFEEDIEIPIRETVRIAENVQVFVVIPVINQRVPIDIPIGANIPIALDINVPVSYEIPVETDIPVNFIVDVPVSTNVPIDTEVPVQLDFPVTVPMENLEINTFLGELQKGLEELAQMLGAE
ncbi:MAG: hypothetical protein AAF614_12810 [Chloroflexota bacterium]